MRTAEMNVLITGATGGIGSALARELAAAGASLLLTARNSERLLRLHDELAATDATVETVVADLGTTEGLLRVADAAGCFEGGVNVLVNNAGINNFGRFEEQTADSLNDLVLTNVLAPMQLTRFMLPQLKRRPMAQIVNVGSILGSIGLPGQVAYSSCKFAMHGFSEALRRELGSTPIRVVYVAPRATDTAMNDAAQRAMNEQTGTATDSPETVARLILQSMQGGKHERFVGWPERLFVKINALLPGVVDNAVSKQASLLSSASSGDQAITDLDGVKQ